MHIDVWRAFVLVLVLVALEESDFSDLIRCDLIRRGCAFERRAHQPPKASFLEDDDNNEDETAPRGGVTTFNAEARIKFPLNPA